jgi:hypothetical protein
MVKKLHHNGHCVWRIFAFTGHISLMAGDSNILQVCHCDHVSVEENAYIFYALWTLWSSLMNEILGVHIVFLQWRSSQIYWGQGLPLDHSSSTNGNLDSKSTLNTIENIRWSHNAQWMSVQSWAVKVLSVT